MLLLLLFIYSVMSDSFLSPWNIVGQSPLSMGFSWQEYCSGLPFSFARHLPDPGIKLLFPELQVGCLLLNHQGFPILIVSYVFKKSIKMCLIHSNFEIWNHVKVHIFRDFNLHYKRATGNFTKKKFWIAHTLKQ